MTYLKWALRLTALSLVLAVLHYTLPQTDIVRIADTYEKRIDFGSNSIFWAAPDAGAAAGSNRDVFFIQSFYENDRPMIYRNEDTGWGWPPYFKFDTSNLQAEANDLKSTKEAPQWVAVRHYGWRNEYFSIHPNATSVWAVASPDQRIIPWFNIVFLIVAFALFWAARVRWIRFRQARIDPILEDVEEGLEASGDRWAERRGRLLDWWRKRRS